MPGEITFKSHKRNTAKFRKLFSELFDSPFTSLMEHEAMISMNVDGKPVALCCLEIEGFEIIRGDVYHSLDIELFEVAENERGKGYADIFLDHLYKRYTPYRVTLRHREDDDGESRDFWKYHGFHFIDRRTRSMELKLVKR